MNDFFDIAKTKAYAELTISGDNLDVEDISKLLGLEISYIRKRGDYSPPRAGVEVSLPSHDNCRSDWSYYTVEKGTEDISVQIEELTSVFKNKVQKLKRIDETYKGCTFSVCVVLYNHQRYLPAVTLSADQIAFLASINAGLNFDVYHNQV